MVALGATTAAPTSCKAHTKLPAMNAMARADIYLDDIADTAPGRFEATSTISTPDCRNSACAGFAATLVIQPGEDDEERVAQRYSFAGWSVGETGSSDFTLLRNAQLAGRYLIDVTDIDQPEYQCHDK